MHRLVALLGLSTLTTAGCGTDCPAGSSLDDDGLCHLDDETGGDSGVSDTDDSGTDDTSDTDDTDTEPIVWQTLLMGCTPASTSTDPITLVGKLNVQNHSFVELIDIEVIPERDLVLAVGQGGLMTLDISDESNPSYLSTVAPLTFYQRFYRLEVGEDDTVYATHRDHGLAVYDISDASSPEEGMLISASDFSGMASTDTHLFLVTHVGDLIVYDITQPQTPTEITRISGLGNPWEPHLLGDRLYIADNSKGIGVVDISDPDSPSLVGYTAASGGVQDLTFSADGSTLYAAVGGAGVETFTLDDPDDPISLGLINVNYSVISVATDGDTLWAADQQDLVGFDISSPEEPALINTEQTEQWAMHVAAINGRAYVADWAYLAIYESIPGNTAPDLAPATTSVYVTAEAQEVINLDNLGNAPLTLVGAESSSGDVVVEFSTDSIAPGETAQMGITYTGSSAEKVSICLATDDPDEPEWTFEVTTGEIGSNTGLGSQAPDFTLTGIDGNSYTLSDQLGKPVVIAYFATW
ncbi:MAG: hypothetical protein ACI8RZ_006753 [Myxococcota bacterium]|jgi:hypothetical protein